MRKPRKDDEGGNFVDFLASKYFGKPRDNIDEPKEEDEPTRNKIREYRLESQFLRQRLRFVNEYEHKGEYLKGVLGMMRFSKHDHPILLEALGDLLTSQMHPNKDAKSLGCRAYLKASYMVTDTSVKFAYRKLAEEIEEEEESNPYGGLKLGALERDFQNEISEGDAWFEILQSNEQQWIREHLDVETMFDRTYRNAPVVQVLDSASESQLQRQKEEVEARDRTVYFAVGVSILMALLIFLTARIRQYKKHLTPEKRPDRLTTSREASA